MPAIATASPAWARVMPVAARGKFQARFRLSPSGARNSLMRNGPFGERAAEQPGGKRHAEHRQKRGRLVCRYQAPSATATRAAASADLEAAEARRPESARFQARNGPIAMSTTIGRGISGTKVALK